MSSGSFVVENVAVFGDVAKGILPLSALVPILVALLMWKYFHRPFGKRDEEEGDKEARPFRDDDEDDEVRLTGGSRMELIDTIASSILLGLLLFHAIPMATSFNYPLYSFTILLGFLPFVFLNFMFKSLQVNPRHNLGGHSQDASLERFSLSDMSGDRPYVETGNASIAEVMPLAYEARVEKRFRRIVAGVAYVCVVFQAGLDVLFMLWNPDRYPTWQLILVLFVDKVLESFVVCSIIIHARAGLKAYCVLVGVFTLVVLISFVPALVTLDPKLAIVAVSHPALKLFVGASAGALLWVVNVLLFMDVAQKPKKCWGAIKGICFSLALFCTWAVGFWS